MGTAAALDAAGGVLAAGTFDGTLAFGNGTAPLDGGGYAGYVARLDPAGLATWATTFDPQFSAIDIHGLDDFANAV